MRTVLLAGAASVLALACSASTEPPTETATAPVHEDIGILRPIQLQPYITIDSIEVGTSGSSVEDAVPVEGRPFYAHFTLHNLGSTTLTGYVGGETLPIDPSLVYAPSNYATDWQVSGLAPGASVSGVVALEAARAELGYGVELFFYTALGSSGEFPTQGTPLYPVNTHVDVAARYQASVSSVNIQRTRSHSTDTDYVSLFGAYAGEEDGTSPNGMMPMANLWGNPNAPQVYIGNVSDGVHNLAANNITTLPFDSVPARSPSPALSFVFLNDGSTSDDTAKSVLDDISDIAQTVLTAVYPGGASAWAAGNAATQNINSILSDCNGVAAVYDIPAIASTDLEVQTRTAPLTQTADLDGNKLGGPYKSPAMCGEAAYYHVSWTYTRLTDPSDTLAFSPATVRLAPGTHQKLSINGATSAIEWSLEGNFRGSTIGQDGTFTLDPNVTPDDDVAVVAQIGSATAKAWINVVPRQIIFFPIAPIGL